MKAVSVEIKEDDTLQALNYLFGEVGFSDVKDCVADALAMLEVAVRETKDGALVVALDLSNGIATPIILHSLYGYRCQLVSKGLVQPLPAQLQAQIENSLELKLN